MTLAPTEQDRRAVCAALEALSAEFPDFGSPLPPVDEQRRDQLARLGPLYREWNARINVISRKDIDQFFVRHVLHSLAMAGHGRHGRAGPAWAGMALHGRAWPSMSGHGPAFFLGWPGMAGLARHGRAGPAWPGWPGMARWARHDQAGPA